jgi:hypothetical protein
MLKRVRVVFLIRGLSSEAFLSCGRKAPAAFCATLGMARSRLIGRARARGQKGFTANKQSYSSSLNGNSKITKDAQEKAGWGISIVNGGTHVQKSGARAFLLAPRK